MKELIALLLIGLLFSGSTSAAEPEKIETLTWETPTNLICDSEGCNKYSIKNYEGWSVFTPKELIIRNGWHDK